MILRSLLTALPVFALAASVAAQEAPSPAAVSSAGILQNPEAYVFSIFTAADLASPRLSPASAFVVSRAGTLLTSFSVVTSYVLAPKKYRIFVDLRDSTVEAKVVALDVVHDLALLSVDHRFSDELAFASHPVRNGDHLTAFGQVSGGRTCSGHDTVLDGSRRAGSIEQLVLGGAALAPFMNGGPLINEQGEVAGGAVAFAKAGHAVSFGIPAAAMQALLEFSRTRTVASPPSWGGTVSAGLEAAADAYSREWLDDNRPPLQFGGWQLLDVPTAMECADQKGMPGVKPQVHRCHSSMAVLPEQDLELATVQMSYALVAAGPSGALLTQLDRSYRESNLDVVGDFFTPQHRQAAFRVTQNKCVENVIVNSRAVPLKVAFCLAGYVRYPGLFDAVAKVATLDRAPAGGESPVLVTMRMNGFRADNVRSAVRKLIESMGRK